MMALIKLLFMSGVAAIVPCHAVAQSDLKNVLKLGPASLCELPQAGEALFASMTARSTNRTVKLLASQSASVSVRRAKLGNKATSTTYRAKPNDPVTWHGVPIVYLEASFVTIPESSGTMTRKLALRANVATVRRILAAQGQDTHSPRQVDYGAYGATIALEQDGDTTALVCRSND
jgi:hypothetical protein